MEKAGGFEKAIDTSAMMEEEQETSNDIYEMLYLYRKYEDRDMREYGRDDDREVEINDANLEFPLGIGEVAHRRASPDLGMTFVKSQLYKIFSHTLIW